MGRSRGVVELGAMSKLLGGHPGPWDAARPWNGWWGANPPYHHPVFVLTHHAREQLALAVARVEGARLHFVDVEPGLNDRRVLQIRRGVAEGDLVALSPPSDLADGAPVQPTEPPRRASGPGGQGGAARSGRSAPAR